MASNESANGGNCILEMKYSNPVPSFEINNIQFYKSSCNHIHVSKCGMVLNDRTMRITAGKLDKDGYPRVSVTAPYIGSRSVHSIMMETFYGKCPNGYSVDHINAIRSDNRLENLRYVTIAYNTQRGRIGKVPKSARKMIAVLGGVEYEFSSKLKFLRAFGIDRRHIDRFLRGVNEAERQGYVILKFERFENHDRIELARFSYRLTLGEIVHEFESISEMMKFLNIPHLTYYSRYISKMKSCCGYEVVDFKEGLETIEIAMKTSRK